MNAESRELLRNHLLLQLDRASAMGLAVGTLVVGLKLAGHHVDSELVKTELQYLVDKGLASAAAKTISPENQRFRVTADGRDYLATQGLA